MFRFFREPLVKKLQTKSNLHDRLLGGILGFVVGDALGVPVEFKRRGDYNPVTDMIEFGTHNQPAGTWSDDTSMTLCLIENLIDDYNREALKQLYCNWYYYGHWTHDGKLPFDIGLSTFKALSKIKAGIAKEEAGLIDEANNGNGSLMRILPLSFYLRDTKTEIKFKMIEEVSGITHAHIRSKIACSLYVETAINLIHGESPKTAYEKACLIVKKYYQNNVIADEMERFNRIFSLYLSNCSMDEINSSGYVIDSLEAGLWCLLNSSSYKEAVLLAVNLGEDTDTIGAITGGLAGIYYGIKGVPPHWIKKLARKKDIIQLSNLFYEHL